MKFSTKTRYAVRIVLELQGAAEPISMAALAEKTGMTPRAVENTHTVLRNHGITASVAGPSGGLKLAKPLPQISLGLLVRLFDEGVELAVCCGEKSNECPNRFDCLNRAAWSDISAAIQTQLDAISLDDIFKKYFLRQAK